MKRKVLFLDHDAGRSGSTVSMEYLAKAFKSAGYEVFVLTPKDQNAASRLVAGGAHILPCHPFGITTLGMDLHFTNTRSVLTLQGFVKLLKDIGKLFIGVGVVWRAIRATGATLLYVNEYALIQGSIAASLAGIPSVLHVRSQILAGTFGVRRACVVKTARVCNGIIVAITKREALQFYGRQADNRKIFVVREFVDEPGDTRELRRSTREELGLRESDLLVVMPGGIQKIKGTIEFLEAAERVISVRSDVFFLVVGGYDGWSLEYYKKCQELVHRLEPTHRLLMRERMTDLRGILSACDILAVPTIVSHFSRPIVEAWSYGKPVVASDVPHHVDIIEDGKDGILYPADDPMALADAVVSLADNPETRERLGAAGKIKSLEQYRADINCRQILQLSDALLVESELGQ